MQAGYENDGVLLARTPNGLNWYLSKKENREFKPLKLPYLENEKDRETLIRRLNEEIASYGSMQEPVYALAKSGESLIPLAKNSYPFPVREESRRWQNFVEYNYTQENSRGERSLKETVCRLKPTITPSFLGEPETMVLAMPWVESEMELEYIARAGYLLACQRNRWLLPYANRIGWRYLPDSSSIIVPFWSEKDLESWRSVEYQPPQKEGLPLSDGKFYPYPEDFQPQTPTVTTTNPDIFWIDGVDFNIKSVEYLRINRKQKAIARIANEIRSGLVPFNPPYPTVDLKDAEIRIQMRESSGYYIVYLVPNNTILGMHKNRKALEVYRRLWSEGELLNDFGHYHYSNPYSELDERGIVKLDLQEEEIV